MQSHHFRSWNRSATLGGALLVALLVVAISALALTSTYALSNGQDASLVLGQATFTSGATGTTASTMNAPRGVAVDPVSGKVFVVESGNNRVLRFASLGSLSNGAAAEGVLGQANFTANTAATTRPA
jgi:DNA-binding beta-propeller fold protein YncE